MKNKTAYPETALWKPALVVRCVSIAFLLCGSLLAETKTVTLPAAASIQGGAPFYSDVRVFNISYTDTLTVTATYRCFIGNPCPQFAAETIFVLPPRQSRSFDNIVGSTFTSPNTAGAVEFEFEGHSEGDTERVVEAMAEDQQIGPLVVSSRLYSTFPTPTVGMLIPGLPSSRAYVDAVLTSIRRLGPGAGFRTNVGVFNPGDQTVDVTFHVLDGSTPVGNPVQRTLEAHSGAQINQIFTEAGVDTLETTSGLIMVNATGRVFSYAAVIDNNTTDPYLILGTEDLPPRLITPVATSTRTPTASGPTATRTVTPPGPTATRTPTAPGPTATLTPTAPGPTATRTPTAPGPTATSTPTAPGPTATRTPTAPAPTATRTPTSVPPTATRTPTPPPPTPTPSGQITVTLVATQFQWSFNGGGSSFTMTVGQSYRLLISDGDPPGSPDHGFTGVPALGLASVRLVAGAPPIVENITPTSSQAGVYAFGCSESGCGSGHGSMLGILIVQ